MVKKRLTTFGTVLGLAVMAVIGQLALYRQRPAAVPVLAEGAFAALGGLRSIAAEVIWFRLDRLQSEGRFVELAQLASSLALMEPHTPEVWSHAAWNLAYNVSVMMPDVESRWRWVYAGLRLLRDEGLRLNPRSKVLLRELAWMFEIKIGTDIDSAAGYYRQRWRELVEDVRRRNAWEELGMEEAIMHDIEQATGFTDWTDPQLSAIYWGLKGGCADIVRQAGTIYQKHRRVQN